MVVCKLDCVMKAHKSVVEPFSRHCARCWDWFHRNFMFETVNV